ncbi:hypothetical protein RFI_07898 [Reticulomyxa filosa]|uniref:Uncharacterized protein n=1 Tax=Reticulomyxa filosa TaxID=46433 RepID=X6NTV8_RETFI|nr:hypothetical protein RFI_07898 [Reticulomyxa filosa]|eukprot:ETO29224.1 hypothetical protein RFI_07898 [Reticulomyxa filosa]
MPGTIRYSQEANKNVFKILRDKMCHTLKPWKQGIGKYVDFVVEDHFAFVYYDQYDMEKGAKDILHRVLSLKWPEETEQQMSPRIEEKNEIKEGHRNNKNISTGWTHSIVMIRHSKETAHRCMTLQLFCSEHNIACLYVQSDENAAKMIGYYCEQWNSQESFENTTPQSSGKKNVNKEHMISFIKVNSYDVDNDEYWDEKDHGTMNYAMAKCITTIPSLIEDARPKVVAEFKSIGAIVNADAPLLEKTIGRKAPAKNIRSFFTNNL